MNCRRVPPVVSFCIALLVTSALCAAFFGYRALRWRLPHAWDFGSKSTLHSWQPFGGAWRTVDGAIANDSEERGAKLMSGAAWFDYQLDADLQVLSGSGDAGLVLRSTSEEEGVDAYRGYYIGVRIPDNTLTIGRADFDWQEAEASRSPQMLLPLRWYHLHVVAVGCRVAGELTDLQAHSLGAVIIESTGDCLRRGRIGLRSVSTAAVWRGVRAAAATESDLERILVRRESSTLISPPRNVRDLLSYYKKLLASAAPSSQTISQPGSLQTVRDLALLPPSTSRSLLIRGEVTLLHPVLFVQDGTGGVEVADATLPALRLGDQVEVDGHGLGTTYPPLLQSGKVRLLWPSIPSPPIFISVDSAVTGPFEGRLIELEGRLAQRDVGDGRLILELATDHQKFAAILDRASPSAVPQAAVGSLMRVTGVRTSDSRYRPPQLPFVLLLRSGDDVQLVSGPPWWSKRNLGIASVTLSFLALLGFLFYIRAEQWRLKAVLEERQRLAHELHDTLAQSFAGIGLQLRALRRKMPANLPTLQADLDLAAAMVRQGHQEARQSISLLRPGGDRPIELLPALVRAAQRIIADHSICIDSQVQGDERPLSLQTLDVLFRAGQEGIANVVRHASARNISITLLYRPDSVILIVQDDGIGLSGEVQSDGFGVAGIAERASAVHGCVRLVPANPKGACLTVEIPLPPRTYARRLLAAIHYSAAVREK